MMQLCPASLEACSDERCGAWGCRITAAMPLVVCSECGEPVFWLQRRVPLCNPCLAVFAITVAKEA